MERFVRFVGGGGLALVAGLWALSLAAQWSPAWFVGAAVAVLGTVALGAGIRQKLTV